jgi:hypothetical protein
MLAPSKKIASSARTILHYYTNSGKIEKPDCCSRCGSKEDIEGHHEDYGRPLDVVWLCFKCHRELHMLLRRANKLNQVNLGIGEKNNIEDPIASLDPNSTVSVMFECRQSLKDDFGACVLADGHETFSAGLRQIMLRYVRRIKARGRSGKVFDHGMPGIALSGISEEIVMPEALGGGLQDAGTAPGRSTMPQDGRSAEDGPVGGVAAQNGQ